MGKGVCTKEDMAALFRAFLDPRPMTPEETEAAKIAFDKMSDWQSMSYEELDDVIAKEEASRSAAHREDSKEGQ